MLELMRHGADGVATCNIEVAEWDELPPLKSPEEDLVVAEEHSGVCVCVADVMSRRRVNGSAKALILPPTLWRSSASGITCNLCGIFP